jgi:hypothetical protein
MRKLFTLLTFASLFAGCASKPPTCDGKERRPINVPAQTGITYPSCGIAA